MTTNITLQNGDAAIIYRADKGELELVLPDLQDDESMDELAAYLLACYAADMSYPDVKAKILDVLDEMQKDLT